MFCAGFGALRAGGGGKFTSKRRRLAAGGGKFTKMRKGCGGGEKFTKNVQGCGGGEKFTKKPRAEARGYEQPLSEKRHKRQRDGKHHCRQEIRHSYHLSPHEIHADAEDEN